MKYYDLFNDIINEGYSSEVALSVIQIMTINMYKKVKKSHIKKPGTFRHEIIVESKEMLYESSEGVVDDAIRIWDVLYDYEIRKDFNGIGGCEKKTIRELILTKKEKK